MRLQHNRKTIAVQKEIWYNNYKSSYYTDLKCHFPLRLCRKPENMAKVYHFAYAYGILYKDL